MIIIFVKSKTKLKPLKLIMIREESTFPTDYTPLIYDSIKLKVLKILLYEYQRKVKNI